MDTMTKLEGVPSRDDAIPGMAFFAGTGPGGKTCGDCVHRGMTVQSQKATFSEKAKDFVYKTYRTTKCKMFKKLAGEHGPSVKADNSACKYFEQKPR